MENELNLVEELRFFAKIVDETNGKLNLIMLSGQLFAVPGLTGHLQESSFDRD